MNESPYIRSRPESLVHLHSLPQMKPSTKFPLEIFSFFDYAYIKQPVILLASFTNHPHTILSQQKGPLSWFAPSIVL
jgi:hypothetical protein